MGAPLGLSRDQWHRYTWRDAEGTVGPLPSVTSITGLQDSLGGADNLMRWGAAIALDYYEGHRSDSTVLALPDYLPTLKANAIAAMKGPANLGSEAHEQVRRCIQGEPLSLTAETAPFIGQFAAFLAKERPDFLYAEETILNLVMGYGGQFDIIASLRGSTGLIDVKTGKVKESHRLQLAGYSEPDVFIGRSGTTERIALPKIDRFYILSLRPDGYELLEQRITKADREHWRTLVEFYGKAKAWMKNGDAAETEPGPENFEGWNEVAPGVVVPATAAPEPIQVPAPMVMTGSPMAPTLPGPAPICPRHKKSKKGTGGYYCPTVVSQPGVEPKVWCDWRVKVA